MEIICIKVYGKNDEKIGFVWSIMESVQRKIPLELAMSFS
jgi:hypothetical protein